MHTLQFTANEPVELSLAYPEGKIVEGRFGDRVMYSLDFPYGHVMFLDLAVAQKINMLEIQPGEHFFLCKRQGAGQRRTIWDVWLSPQTEKARAAKETAAMPPPPPAPLKPQAPAEQPSLLERQLQASIVEAQIRKAPQSELSTGTHGPVPVPMPTPALNAIAAAAPAWVGMLVADTNALLDAYNQCLAHADQYGNRVKPEDVRALLTTAYINRAKGDRHAA